MCRQGRGGQSDVEWNEWKLRPVTVQYFPKNFILTTDGSPDYGKEDYQGNGLYVCEDFYLELKTDVIEKVY